MLLLLLTMAGRDFMELFTQGNAGEKGARVAVETKIGLSTSQRNQTLHVRHVRVQLLYPKWWRLRGGRRRSATPRRNRGKGEDLNWENLRTEREGISPRDWVSVGREKRLYVHLQGRQESAEAPKIKYTLSLKLYNYLKRKKNHKKTRLCNFKI